MAAGSRIIRNILFVLSVTIILSLILTAISFPYSSIIANRYLKFGFYQTILSEFFNLYFSCLLRSVIITAISSILLFISPLRKRVEKAAGGSAGKFLITGGIAAVLLLSLGFFKYTGKRWEKKPNILFIVVDTLRTDHTSIIEPGLRTTGFLKDNLLPDSVFFRRGQSNSPWTLPSISSLLTSKYPSQLGIRSLISKIGDREFTFAELMKDEGYRTGGIISHILLKKEYGFHQGFDYFNDRNISGDFGNHMAISSPGISEDAIEFLKNRKGEKFFLFLHYFDPHYIYLDHEKKVNYQGKFTTKDISKLREMIRNNDYSAEDTGYLRYCYDTEIRFTDYHIGRVIKELKNQGVYDNTIIVFTSDHGEEFVERGWLGHSTTLYREQTGVPILFKTADPSHLKLRDNRNIPVSNIDIVPTLIRMADIKKMPGTAGTDLLAMDPENHTFFAEVSQKEFGTPIELVSVTWKNWKMIRDLRNNRFELYNLIADPQEKNNLAGLKPEIGSKLKMKLQKWIKINRRPGKRDSGRNRKALSDSEREKLKTLGYIN